MAKELSTTPTPTERRRVARTARAARRRDHRAALRYAEDSTPAQRWTFLAVVSLGLLMIGLDNSILYTALPRLTHVLHASALQSLWIINAYPLILAGLLLGTGTLGDRVGHRRMFITGLAIFGLASLAAAFSPSAWALVAARAFLGFAAAVMMPATLALIRLTFADERERNTAIGIWGSVAVVGAAAGPVLGGFLLEHFYWGSVFLINVPICVIALGLTLLIAPPNVPHPDKRWDFISSLYALFALGGFTMTIKELARGSWTLASVALLVAICGGWVFVRRQNKLADPLLTFDIFRSRIFAGGVAAAAGGMFVLAGAELTTTQKLQLADDWTPLHAGLVVAIAAVCAIPMSVIGGAVLHKVGFLPLISGGFLSLTAGVLLAAWATHTGLQPALYAGMMLVGLGAGSAMSVSSTAIIGAAPLNRTGMAAGVEEVSYEFGTLISVALTGSLLPMFLSAQLPEELRGLGLAIMDSAEHASVAEPAYARAYVSVLIILGVIAAAFTAYTGWAFHDNPKSGGNGGTHE